MNVHLQCATDRIVGFSVSVLSGQSSRAWNWIMFLQKTPRNKQLKLWVSTMIGLVWDGWLVCFWHGRVLVLSCSRVPEIPKPNIPQQAIYRERDAGTVPVAVPVSSWHANYSLKCSTVLRGMCFGVWQCWELKSICRKRTWWPSVHCSMLNSRMK